MIPTVEAISMSPVAPDSHSAAAYTTVLMDVSMMLGMDRAVKSQGFQVDSMLAAVVLAIRPPPRATARVPVVVLVEKAV